MGSLYIPLRPFLVRCVEPGIFSFHDVRSRKRKKGRLRKAAFNTRRALRKRLNFNLCYLLRGRAQERLRLRDLVCSESSAKNFVLFHCEFKHWMLSMTFRTITNHRLLDTGAQLMIHVGVQCKRFFYHCRIPTDILPR